MRNKLSIAIIILSGSLLFNCQMVKAQDYRFTQMYQNPLILNPAIMGASNDMVAGLCYRNQWGSVNSGYSTYSFNGMYPIFYGGGDTKGKLDAGLSIMEDKAGAFSSLSGLLAVDYNREITDDQYLCLALLGGFGQEAVNTSDLTFDGQYVNGAYSASNPSNETTLSQKKMYPDVGFGFTWYMNPSKDKSKINAYLGISGFHLNQPNISLVGADSKLPIKMSYIGGIKIFESDKIEITPNAMVTTQAGNVETALGTYVDYIFAEGTKLTIGLWYRRNDAIAILVGFEYKGFSLGYSYDAVTSTITSNISTGLNANEITLTYRLNRRKAGTKTSAQFNTNSGSDLNKGSSSSSGGGDAGNPSPFPHF